MFIYTLWKNPTKKTFLLLWYHNGLNAVIKLHGELFAILITQIVFLFFFNEQSEGLKGFAHSVTFGPVERSTNRKASMNSLISMLPSLLKSMHLARSSMVSSLISVWMCEHRSFQVCLNSSKEMEPEW